MSQRNEVTVLTEAINDREDDGFAANAGQRFDEVHSDVAPDRGRDGQRKK